MDAATLQARIYSGYAKAAFRTGYVFDVYRPASAVNALAPANKVASLNAVFSVRGDKGFAKTPGYKDQLWDGQFDATNLQVGDYLTNPQHGTYFIAAREDFLPLMCVRCNHVLDVVTAPEPSGVGALPYSGTTAGGETPVMTQFPGSVMYQQRGRASEVGLPMDLPSPFFEILLPAVDGVTLRTSDTIKDDLGQRFTVSASELSILGWRLSCQIAVT